MDILIIHKMSYGKIEYHRGIDHDAHDVTYIGTAKALANIPSDLRCTRLERGEKRAVHEEVIAVLERTGASFDRVISLSEYELLDAARVRAHFGIPGPSLAQVNLVRDKVAMKHAVARAGLRVPRYMALAEALRAPRAMEWPGATVLKPVDGAKSEDVRVFDSPAALVEAVSARRAGVARLDREQPDIAGYEVEEFVSGPVIHFDGLVCNGRLHVLVASDYLNTCLGFAEGQPLGSCQRPLASGERSWVEQVLKAVQIDAGSFHLEAIVQDGEPVFLEVANRFGGAEVVATVELATGVHLPTEELATLTTGRPALPSEALITAEGHYGWFVFPGHRLHPVHWTISQAKRFRHSPHVVKWDQLPAGTRLSGDVTYGASESPLAGIVRGPQAGPLRAFVQDLFDTVRVHSDPVAAT